MAASSIALPWFTIAVSTLVEPLRGTSPSPVGSALGPLWLISCCFELPATFPLAAAGGTGAGERARGGTPPRFGELDKPAWNWCAEWPLGGASRSPLPPPLPVRWCACWYEGLGDMAPDITDRATWLPRSEGPSIGITACLPVRCVRGAESVSGASLAALLRYSVSDMPVTESCNVSKRSKSLSSSCILRALGDIGIATASMMAELPARLGLRLSSRTPL
mmetsp:Transcript_19321/g.48598  ORF Transcript_19321/g.48598 Transcript_19321/m.48598 type:complete len:220 (+) Transcript_19321:1882-2541(+)